MGGPWEDYAEPAPKPVPQGGSALLPVLSGLTFGASDELAGLGGGIASTLKGEGFRKGYDFMREDMRAGKDEYSQRHPYLSPALEIGAGVAAPISVLGSAVARARPLATSVASGALYGFNAGEGGVENRLEDAAIGGTIGAGAHGAGRVAGAVLGTVIPRIAPRSRLPDFQRAVRNLDDNGIPVTASERIGSPAGRLAETTSGSYLGMGDRIAGRENALFGSLMSRANFHPEDIARGELSQAAVNRAQQRFTQGYDQALTGVRVQLGDMDPALRQIQNAYGTLLPFEQRATISSIMNDFRQQIGAGRVIGGRDYQRLRSQLGKMADSAAKNTNLNYLAPVYSRMRAALDTAFTAAAPRNVSARVAELNSQYGAFKVLQKAEGNPEAIGTLANHAWREGRRVDPQFVRLARDYQKVLLRGGYRTSGSAENTAGMRLVPPVLPMVRAGIGAPWQAYVAPRLPEVPFGVSLPAAVTGGAYADDMRESE